MDEFLCCWLGSRPTSKGTKDISWDFDPSCSRIGCLARFCWNALIPPVFMEDMLVSSAILLEERWASTPWWSL